MIAVTTVVPDTSVVLKWFRRAEELRTEVLAIRSAYLRGAVSLRCPDLLLYEVANVLRYKPDQDQSLVQQAVSSLIGMGIRPEEATEELMDRAVQIGFAHDVSVYDSVFVAFAEQVGATFVTADGKLIQRLGPLAQVLHLALWASP